MAYRENASTAFKLFGFGGWRVLGVWGVEDGVWGVAGRGMGIPSPKLSILERTMDLLSALVVRVITISTISIMPGLGGFIQLYLQQYNK